MALEEMMSRGGKGLLMLPFENYAYGSLDVVHEMITDPASVLGIADGGAHVGIMCDATATSYTLTHWTRDRRRGSLLPVSWEKINDGWYNYVKGHNPKDYFGIYDVVRFDTFWLDK